MVRYGFSWTAAVGAAALLLAPAACEQKSSRSQSSEQEKLSKAQQDEQQKLTQAQQAQQQAGASSSASSSSPQLTASGEVVRASQQELVLRQSNGQPDLRLKVGSDTPVLIGGQQGSISDLKEGTQVRAAYQEQDGAPQAIRIEAQPSGSSSGSSGSPSTTK